MRKLITFFIASVLSLSSYAYPWGHRYAAEQADQNIVTDVNTSFTVSVEWGEGDWDGAGGSMFGYGLTTDGTGWTWVEINWFQDGDGSNKRCKTVVSIAEPGKYYYAYRMIKASSGGTSYTFGSSDWAENSASLNASSTIVVGKVSKADGDWAIATNWEGDVAPVSTDHVAILNTISISSAAEAASVLIQSGKSVSISDGASLYVSGDLANNAGVSGLVIHDGGSLFHSTADVPGTMEREVSVANWANEMDGWHLISSPVSGQAISGEWTPTGTGNDYDFYAWDELSNNWLNQKDPLNNITGFIPGEGYLVAYEAGGTKTFTGNLNVADITLSNLSRTGSSYYTGFHLLGNPFACALKWDNGNWALSNVGGVASVWSETGQNYLSLDTPGDLIPANQGFFVQVTDASNSITLPADDRTTDAVTFYKDARPDYLKFRITNAVDETFDETVIRLNGNAGPAFDPAYDGHKISGSSAAPQLYSRIGESEMLAVNTFGNAAVPESVELGFIPGSETTYTLSAVENTFSRNLTLADTKTGTTFDLATDPEYVFTAQPGDDPNRFVLYFGVEVGLTNPAIDDQLRIYATSGKICISSISDMHLPVSITNLLGSTVYSGETSGKSLTILDAGSIPDGIYIVTVLTGRQPYSRKVILQ